jgi:hypothetical protein
LYYNSIISGWSLNLLYPNANLLINNVFSLADSYLFFGKYMDLVRYKSDNFENELAYNYKSIKL